MINECPKCNSKMPRYIFKDKLGADITYWKCEICGYTTPSIKNDFRIPLKDGDIVTIRKTVTTIIGKPINRYFASEAVSCPSCPIGKALCTRTILKPNDDCPLGFEEVSSVSFNCERMVFFMDMNEDLIACLNVNQTSQEGKKT